MEYNINDEDLNDLISEAKYIIDNNVNTNVTKEAEGYTDDVGGEKGNVNIGGEKNIEIKSGDTTIKISNSNINDIPKTNTTNKQFDFSSMSKEKFSTGNTKVGNLVNSLKDKGIITSELMENEETLGLVKGLLRDIHKDLVKGKDLEGLLNTNLNTDEFGENIDVGIAKFISKNSPNTSQKNFEQIAGNVIKPLSNNGMIEAKSMYKSLKNERKARLEIEKKLQIIL